MMSLCPPSLLDTLDITNAESMRQFRLDVSDGVQREMTKTKADMQELVAFLGNVLTSVLLLSLVLVFYFLC